MKANLTAAKTADHFRDLTKMITKHDMNTNLTRDGKRTREILCRKGDLELVMKALAECETITEFTRRQRKEYHFNDLYIELPYYGV